MAEQNISYLLKEQNNFFHSGSTLPVSNRQKALKKLQSCIRMHEEDIQRALFLDLGKSGFESYMCETGLTLSELSYMLRRLPRYAKDKKVRTPLSQFSSRSSQKPSPYGTVLIMSPWNYPFLLSMEPLIDAIAAGNTVILKPSAYSPHTSEIIKTIIGECFAPSYAAVVTGGRKENAALLNHHFDYIFLPEASTWERKSLKRLLIFLLPSRWN